MIGVPRSPAGSRSRAGERGSVVTTTALGRPLEVTRSAGRVSESRSIVPSGLALRDETRDHVGTSLTYSLAATTGPSVPASRLVM